MAKGFLYLIFYITNIKSDDPVPLSEEQSFVVDFLVSISFLVCRCEPPRIGFERYPCPGHTLFFLPLFGHNGRKVVRKGWKRFILPKKKIKMLLPKLSFAA